MLGKNSSNSEMSKWDKLQMISGWSCSAVILFCLFGWEYVFSSSWCSVPWTVVMIIACITYVVTTSIFDYQERKRVNQGTSGFVAGTVIKGIVAAVLCALLIIMCVQTAQRSSAPSASASASGQASASAVAEQ